MSVKSYSARHQSPGDRAHNLSGRALHFVRFVDLPDTFMEGKIGTAGIPKPDNSPHDSQSEPMVELVWDVNYRQFFTLDWRNLIGNVHEHSIDLDDIPVSTIELE